MALSLAELEEKYLHDPYFNRLADMLVSVLEAGHMDAEEVGGACVLAVKVYKGRAGVDDPLRRMARRDHSSALGIGERVRQTALGNSKGE